VKLLLENGNYGCFADDPHTPASLFKMWFRELESPVIADEFYDMAIKSVKDPVTSSKMIELLDAESQHVVKWTVACLRKVCSEEFVQKNRMTASNLAMIFAPNLLRCRSPDPIIIMAEQKFQQKFVQNLIDQLDTRPTELKIISLYCIGNPFD